MSLKIISGGQTGVDRGALDAALQAGIPCGGWCPKGRRAEDGVIDTRYPLSEINSSQYQLRTRQNVIDSDATLIIYFTELEGGTARTCTFCQELGKPCCLVDAISHSVEQAAAGIKEFIVEHDIRVLNVAGPRASKQPQAQQYTKDIMLAVLLQLSSSEK